LIVAKYSKTLDFEAAGLAKIGWTGLIGVEIRSKRPLSKAAHD